jgi:5-methylcytosine-specific restriction endonuclease McrA
MTNRKVICAGCSELYSAEKTHFYRKKRCCGLESCVENIDNKIKHNNYLKQRRKYANGTHRRGVEPLLRSLILNRDENRCRSCYSALDELQVHHIIPVSKGGDDSITNLITLCKICHTVVHQEGDENYVQEFKIYTQNYEKEISRSIF